MWKAKIFKADWEFQSHNSPQIWKSCRGWISWSENLSVRGKKRPTVEMVSKGKKYPVLTQVRYNDVNFKVLYLWQWPNETEAWVIQA